MNSQEHHGLALVLSRKSPLFLSATLEHYVSTRLVSVVLVGSFLCGVVLLASCSHSTPPPDGSDTTSHNFSWQVQMLGDGGSSVLHDVAIINDTLAYAVGELYLHDSTGQLDPISYNFAQWNGQQWRISREASNVGIRAILAFSPSDIWVATGGPYHWNGSNWRSYSITGVFYGNVNALWGVDSSNVYMVGENGAIAHYNGSVWQKIETGTTLPILDIWGAVNPNTGVTEIYAVASNTIDFPAGKKLLRITATQAVAMSDSGLNVFLTSIWFSPGTRYYIVGSGVFYSSSINQSTVWQGGPNIVTSYWTNAIRGTAANDIFLVGSYGDVVHFNGSTWKSFQGQTGMAVGNYWSVALKGNLSIAVGGNGDRAVVAIGRRR
jgi:hypothetical protein